MQKPVDWGLNFHRIQALRRSKKYDQAAKLMLAAPTDLASQVNPDGWWKERRANAYKAMERGKYKLAYNLVRDSGPLTVNALNAQRFLAGWIAFSKLKNPKLAKPHFVAMTQSADGLKRDLVRIIGPAARLRRLAIKPLLKNTIKKQLKMPMPSMRCWLLSNSHRARKTSQSNHLRDRAALNSLNF